MKIYFINLILDIIPPTITFKEKKKDLLQENRKFFPLPTNIHLVNHFNPSSLTSLRSTYHSKRNHKRTEKHAKDPKNEG